MGTPLDFPVAYREDFADQSPSALMNAWAVTRMAFWYPDGWR
jgi:hypothetical protein